MSEEHSFGPRGAAAEDPAEAPSRSAPSGPSFLERVAGYFRARPGTLRENIADALAESAEDAEAFSPTERTMLNNVLGLREVSVEDVMIPRADIEAVEINTRLADLLGIFERSGHSRMPVYVGSMDDPRGMVHIRDVLAHITRNAYDANTQGEGGAIDLARVDLSETVENLNLIRTVHFVPPSMRVSDLMARMQATRIHVALVIDEYGGTDGLVSLEDILETVVGDITDEHDREEALVTLKSDGVYVADAKATIEEAVEVIGPAFAAGEHQDYVDTIGGMITNELGRVPQRGEVVEAVPGFDIHVLEADRRRVKRVEIVRRPAPPAQP